jgi:hypothetical protein
VPEGHGRFRMTGKLEKAYINCGRTCSSVMCAAGFAAAHDHRTFRRTFQFTNALHKPEGLNKIIFLHVIPVFSPESQCCNFSMTLASILSLIRALTIESGCSRDSQLVMRCT